MYTHTSKPETRYTYYVVADVRAVEDWKTKQVEVKASLGIAPDSQTVIEYPIQISQFGYWNKTQIRKIVRETRHKLFEEMGKIGYTKADLTEPIKVTLFWER